MSNDPCINSALFQFAQMANDGPREGGPALPRASKEDLEWLKQAAQAVEAPEKTMKKTLDALQNDEKTDDEKIEVLEELSDFVEDINIAMDFMSMNGVIILMLMLKRQPENPEMRRLLALTLAQSAQHHPKVQEQFVQLKYAEQIIPMFNTETCPKVRAALIHLCSCMCRECAPGTAGFLEAKGMDSMVFLLNQYPEDHKTNARIFFLAEYLAATHNVAAIPMIELSAAHVVNDFGNANVQERAASACIEFLAKSEKTVYPVLMKQLGDDLNQLGGGDESPVATLVQKLKAVKL